VVSVAPLASFLASHAGKYPAESLGTIGRFHFPVFCTYQQAAVSILNDVIQQEGQRRSFDILELRTLFSDQAGYANPIEPSAIGGAKLAKGMSAWVVKTRAVGDNSTRRGGKRMWVRAKMRRCRPKTISGV
jgi:hypothetical protein